MFDTMKVAQRIREARNARNMTQMALADEMGVSYQAISNWERGNSMPDISKLEQLCDVLHITIYALLGTDNKQAETVNRILGEGEPPEIEDVAEIAPIVPPEKIRETMDRHRQEANRGRQAADYRHRDGGETGKPQRMNLKAIIAMAPFLDQEMLDEILQNVEPDDCESICALAPFLSRQTLDELVLRCDEEADRKLVMGLAPFLSQETTEKLLFKYNGELDRELLSSLAPFLSQETMDRVVEQVTLNDINCLLALAPFLNKEALDKLVFSYDGEMNSQLVNRLAPFLSQETLDKLVQKCLDTGDTKGLTGLYPFLSKETMRALVRKMMEAGDFDTLRDAAPFM